MTTRHGGGHHRGGRGGFAFVPGYVVAYDLGACDPNDPFYKECVARFGDDFLTGIISEDGLWTSTENEMIAHLGDNDKSAALYDQFRNDMLAWRQYAAAMKTAASGWFGSATDEDKKQLPNWETRRLQWVKDLQAAAPEAKLPTAVATKQEIIAPPTSSVTPYLIGGGVAVAAVVALAILSKEI
jgi:hypothetical protein